MAPNKTAKNIRLGPEPVQTLRMQMHQRPDPERLHVLASRLRFWIADVCVWLAEWFGVALPRDMRMTLRADMRHALAGARVLVLLLAMARWAPTPLRVRTYRPASAPPGFRRTSLFANDGRNIRRAVRLRGRTISARLAALRDILHHLGAWARGALKRVNAGPRAPRLVLCWMRADVVHALAAPAAPSGDTS
jgi:hypothetical protein